MNQKRIEIVRQRRKKLLWVFAVTFFVIFVFFSWLASVLTPKMGNPVLDGEEEDLTVSSSEFKGRVDSRLKFIEIQDTNPKPEEQNESQDNAQENESLYANQQPQQTQKDPFSQGLKPAQPEQEDQSFEEESYYDEETGYEVNGVSRPPKPSVPNATSSISKEPKIKVFIGSYGSRTEAEMAAERLGATVLSDTPFVKQINGRYTLQAGSFSDPEAARQMSKDLESYNLYVKMVKE